MGGGHSVVEQIICLLLALFLIVTPDVQETFCLLRIVERNIPYEVFIPQLLFRLQSADLRTGSDSNFLDQNGLLSGF